VHMDRPVKVRDRLGRSSKSGKREGQVRQCGGVMRIEPDGLLELPRCRFHLAGVQRGYAQVGSYLDVPGVALEMEPELGDGFREPAEPEEDEAEVPTLVAERIGTKGQCALEVLDRFYVVTAGIERRGQVSVAPGAGGIDFESQAPERVFVVPALD